MRQALRKYLPICQFTTKYPYCFPNYSFKNIKSYKIGFKDIKA